MKFKPGHVYTLQFKQEILSQHSISEHGGHISSADDAKRLACLTVTNGGEDVVIVKVLAIVRRSARVEE